MEVLDSSSTSLYIDFSEVRQTICFRPDPNAACFDKCLVEDLHQTRAVERHFEFFAVTSYAKRVPDVRKNREILTRYLSTHTLGYLVEPDVIFKRVGPCHVVMVSILKPNHNPSGLIHGAVDCLEPYDDFHVLCTQAAPNAKREAIVGGVTTGFGNYPSSRRARILQHLPSNGLPLTRKRFRKSQRLLSERHLANVDLHRTSLGFNGGCLDITAWAK